MSGVCVRKRITSLWVSHPSIHRPGSGGGKGGIGIIGEVKRERGFAATED
jgi:hypothetical protein